MASDLNQYLRAWEIQINGQRFIDNNEGRQFRCVFDILINPGDTLATADIRLYNLAKTTTVSQRDDIVFSAGYQNSFDILFAGSITNVLKERQGPDVITRLLCSSLQRGTAVSSYGASVRLVDVLKDLARRWPLTLEMDESQFTDADSFPSGYTISGDIPYALDRLAYAFKFNWTQDRGSLVITRIDKERTGTVFEVNQFTGMVGMPEMTRGPNGLGVDVTMRINPFIRTTSRINVKSEFATYNTGNMLVAEIAGDASASGEYNVFSIRYTGDTHGEAWDMRMDAIRAGTKALAAASAGGSLIWGAVVSQEFRAKVRGIAQRQGLDANWYMAVMAFETGRTFSPSVKNAAGSGATGLIQFMPSTARDQLGTTTQALANMTAVQQLDYVEKYFQPYASKIRNIGDMYMAVFMPTKGIGRPDDFVLIDRAVSQTVYNQNAGLDKDRDGKITRGEAVERVLREAAEGQQHMG